MQGRDGEHEPGAAGGPAGNAAPRRRGLRQALAGGWSGPADSSSVIPSPPRENKVFVEDDDGTGRATR
jgi:hypothetical protein